MEKGIIYCSHNSLSGMKYIGQTINSLKHRMNQHYLQSKNGKTKFSKELNKNKKYFIIETPSGDIVKDTGISDFCKKNDLCVSHMSQVLSGKRKSHKGYKLPINKISKDLDPF